MPPSTDLQGTFASDQMRRRERRWQRAGLLVLAAVVGAALAGLVGNAATVGRAVGVYAFLLVVFRVSGRRTLAQVTNFDLILVLIIGDATQQALIGDDYSIAGGLVAVSTLVILDVGLARAKVRWPAVDVLVDGLPLPIIRHGVPSTERMASEGVTTDDVLTAAREAHGLSRTDQIAFAVLEQSGGISIVPATPGRSRPRRTRSPEKRASQPEERRATSGT
jgi:uncharacterized membrane protein YcaP (DUF421 family)